MDVRQALQELADKIKDEVIRRMHSPIGINPRIGKNTLEGSKLEKSVDVRVEGEEALVFSIADYFEFVVSGWRKTGAFPGTKHLFIKNINKWVRDKQIHIYNLTQSQIVYYLYKKMLIEGREIKARPFIESGYLNNEDPSKVLNFLDDFFDEWADEVFKKITEEVDKYFNE